MSLQLKIFVVRSILCLHLEPSAALFKTVTILIVKVIRIFFFFDFIYLFYFFVVPEGCEGVFMELVVVAAAQPPQQGSDLPSPSIVSPIHNPMLSQQLAKDASTGNKLPLLANEESYGKRQLFILFLLL